MANHHLREHGISVRREETLASRNPVARPSKFRSPVNGGICAKNSAKRSRPDISSRVSLATAAIHVLTTLRVAADLIAHWFTTAIEDRQESG
jgi:glycine cleavage system H lipoate-binding protein